MYNHVLAVLSQSEQRLEKTVGLIGYFHYYRRSSFLRTVCPWFFPRENRLPIDMNQSNTLDWRIDRFHCARNVQEKQRKSSSIQQQLVWRDFLRKEVENTTAVPPMTPLPPPPFPFFASTWLGELLVGQPTSRYIASWTNLTRFIPDFLSAGAGMKSDQAV